MKGRTMAEFYISQERAMAPGIAGEWPGVIEKPDNPNGRLLKIKSCQRQIDEAIEELERVAMLGAIPEPQRRAIGDVAGTLRLLFT